MDTNTTPTRWYVGEWPTEGALVVPLWCTPADVAEAVAKGAQLLRVTRVNDSTKRASARVEGGPARPVVHSNRAGGGWRQGGRWVQFATPSTEPDPDELAAEQAQLAPVPLADDEPQAPVRPAWLYRNGSLPEGEAAAPGSVVADDSPDTTPRPSLELFATAAWQAVAARERHEASCARCRDEGAENGDPGWCATWTALARRAHDAQQAAHSLLATVR